MMVEEWSDEYLSQKVKNVGQGSDFRYDTVVVPMTAGALVEMMAEAEESFHHVLDIINSLDGKVTGGITAHIRDFFVVRPIRNKLEKIIDLESEILEKVHVALVADSLDRVDQYILASAMKTTMQCNKHLEAILDSSFRNLTQIISESSELQQYDSQLRVQKNSVMGITSAI